MSVPSVEPQLYAGDLRIGQRFEGAPRAVGDAQFGAFAALTGDAHPIHYDDAFAARSRYGRRLAHGLLLTSMTALGATPLSRQLEDAMVAFVEHGFRFLQPVFVDDTLTCHFEVTAVQTRAGGRAARVRFAVQLVNQDGQPVLEGHHIYLLTLQKPA